MNRYLEVPKGEDVQNRSSSEAKNTYKPSYTKTLESGFMAQEVEKAAKELDFITAAQYRDEVFALKKKLKGV